MEEKASRRKWPPLTSKQIEEAKRLRAQGLPRKKAADIIGCAEHQIKLLEWKESGHESVKRQPKQQVVAPKQEAVQKSVVKKKRGGYARYSQEQLQEWADTVVVMRMDDVTSSMTELAGKAGAPKSQWKKVIELASELYKKEMKAAVEKEYYRIEVPSEAPISECLPKISIDLLVLEVMHRFAATLEKLEVPLAGPIKNALKPLPNDVIKIRESKESRKRVLLVGFKEDQAKLLASEYPTLDIRFANNTQSVPNVTVGWVLCSKFVGHPVWEEAKKRPQYKTYWTPGLTEARKRLSEIIEWNKQP